jgi:hypothetical protein
VRSYNVQIIDPHEGTEKSKYGQTHAQVIALVQNMKEADELVIQRDIDTRPGEL